MIFGKKNQRKTDARGAHKAPGRAQGPGRAVVACGAPRKSVGALLSPQER